MKFFSILERLLEPRRPPRDNTAEGWRRDPLSHPAIEAMSPRERADLPLPWRPARPSRWEVRRCA